jgi:hypothetical protein
MGDCDMDNDCADGLVCFQRDDLGTILGCDGEGQYGRDYCIVDGDHLTPLPVTTAPTPPVPDDVTYRSGEVFMIGLKLSTGLSARIIAETGTKIQFDTRWRI